MRRTVTEAGRASRKQSDQTGAHLLVVLKLRAGDQHDLS